MKVGSTMSHDRVLDLDFVSVVRAAFNGQLSVGGKL